MKKYLISIIFLSLIALWPFFKPGFFESHDGEWMIIRFTAFHQTLAAGQFPVRFVDRLNNNYGYPVMNFLYPLPFYLAEMPKILGLSFVDSIKIIFVVSTVFSVVAMFWALSQFFSKYASLAGAIIYLFIPYRFVDLYVRGSLGENVSFAIAPLVLGSIFIVSKGNKLFLPVLSVGTALLITAHNVIALLFIPLFFLVSITLIKKDRIKMTVAFLVGILISTFFWLPALYDLHYVKLSQIKISNITDHLAPLNKLIVPSWGYGPALLGDNGFSPQIGLTPFAISLTALYFFINLKRKNSTIGILISMFIFSLFLMTKFSAFLWQKVPFLDVIQFPWRLLSLIVISSSVLTAFVIDSTKYKRIVASLIISASIVSAIVYTKPYKFVDRQDAYYATNEDTTTVKDEYMPLWVKEKPKDRASEKITLSGDGEITDLYIRPTKYQATISLKEESRVQVNSIYFPGWQAFIDKQNVDLIYKDNPNGLMAFKLPRGSHTVIIKYGKTPVHLASEIISLAALMGTGYYLYIQWRKQSFQ